MFGCVRMIKHQQQQHQLSSSGDSPHTPNSQLSHFKVFNVFISSVDGGHFHYNHILTCVHVRVCVCVWARGNDIWIYNMWSRAITSSFQLFFSSVKCYFLFCFILDSSFAFRRQMKSKSLFEKWITTTGNVIYKKYRCRKCYFLHL